MAEYDFAGRTEKTSISGGGSQGTDLYYKPRSFKLNKYITLKCSKVRTYRTKGWYTGKSMLPTLALDAKLQPFSNMHYRIHAS